MRKTRKVATQQRISYGAARRAACTYGARVIRAAERAMDTKVESIGTHAEYLEWRRALPLNVLKVVVLFEIEACMEADRRMWQNAI